MKVLVISANGFSKTLNNGKTLEAMFSAFNRDDLCQIVSRPQKQIDFEFCNSYYCITEADTLIGIVSKRESGNILNRCTNIGSSNTTDRLYRLKKMIPQLIRDIAADCTNWQTEKFNKWLIAQKPDLLFLVGGSRFLHSIALYVKSYLNIPLATFYTDDYIIYPHFYGLTGSYLKNKLIASYRKIISESNLCFAIGDIMSKEYAEYFGKKFHPIMNALAPESYIEPESHNNIVVSYFGGLHLNRWQMLIKFRKLLPDNIEFNVYTSSVLSEKIAKSFNDSKIIHRGCISGEELRNAMLNSDILLHVESDDKSNRRLTRLSVSTKIPEYLMSGRCIIGFGPQEVASMKELSNNDVGYSIDSTKSDSDIREQLKLILSDRTQFQIIGKRGYDFALKKYDGIENARVFKEKLNSIIN